MSKSAMNDPTMTAPPITHLFGAGCPLLAIHEITFI
jgi:hypothetical protein